MMLRNQRVTGSLIWFLQLLIPPFTWFWDLEVFCLEIFQKLIVFGVILKLPISYTRCYHSKIGARTSARLLIPWTKFNPPDISFPFWYPDFTLVAAVSVWAVGALTFVVFCTFCPSVSFERLYHFSFWRLAMTLQGQWKQLSNQRSVKNLQTKKNQTKPLNYPDKGRIIWAIWYGELGI